MPIEQKRIDNYLRHLSPSGDVEELGRRLRPQSRAMPPRVPGGTDCSLHALEARWRLIGGKPEAMADEVAVAQAGLFERNIENYIGTVKIPVGLAGPLRVNGIFANGDYYVPLATTEAALVASYSRGAWMLSKAGGCAAMVVSEGVMRSPGFAFASLEQAGLFVSWAVGQVDEFRKRAESTTRHGKLVDMRVALEGNHVYLQFEFTTGDASGQNMVTIATDAICSYINEACPVRPQYWFVEANFSGDKKASALSFLGVRGKKVSAEAVLPPSLLRHVLRTDAERMTQYWRMAAVGGVLSGSMGVHGHYANGLAALYLATGQDAACVAESATGVTRFEAMADGSLYASVTLPNVIVGTVGGGTGLPSQSDGLSMMGLKGEGKVQAFAEVATALCLAGELSIIGALCSHEFTRAHKRLARGKTP